MSNAGRAEPVIEGESSHGVSVLGAWRVHLKHDGTVPLVRERAESQRAEPSRPPLGFDGEVLKENLLTRQTQVAGHGEDNALCIRPEHLRAIENARFERRSIDELGRRKRALQELPRGVNRWQIGNSLQRTRHVDEA